MASKSSRNGEVAAAQRVPAGERPREVDRRHRLALLRPRYERVHPLGAEACQQVADPGPAVGEHQVDPERLGAVGLRGARLGDRRAAVRKRRGCGADGGDGRGRRRREAVVGVERDPEAAELDRVLVAEGDGGMNGSRPSGPAMTRRIGRDPRRAGPAGRAGTRPRARRTRGTGCARCAELARRWPSGRRCRRNAPGRGRCRRRRCRCRRPRRRRRRWPRPRRCSLRGCGRGRRDCWCGRRRSCRWRSAAGSPARWSCRAGSRRRASAARRRWRRARGRGRPGPSSPRR